MHWMQNAEFLVRNYALGMVITIAFLVKEVMRYLWL
jgi:hypothetical protein